jgi:4-hydroxy-4-methyl-2-oxoglutarate aldolase
MSLRTTLNGLREFDTALLANTIGYVDPTPAHEYYMGRTIRSVTPSLGPTCGVAVTCELDSSTPGSKPDFAGYYEMLAQMEAMEEPVVWVVKTVGSRPDHECVMGDGMAKDLFSVGCAGVVTDGGVRDIPGMLTVPFAAYSNGITIHHTALRFRAVNQPVEVGGITVQTGDILHANMEGVIKIPKACVNDLAGHATRMYAFEREAHYAFREPGLPRAQKTAAVMEALAKYGFAKS